ncbi:uncharacterized protein F5891DRAFT_1197425 [Suillus fuscotomentosus]|uniref:Uncharacterized protein n=1 Tax=Suillus fuscotomentosus TaxID=1912939 RepID=A0AAD4DTR7_9AGAM|nr:uncharacterized protein F5891DRAFT_1197425 [Suillus fuscotomentosus]KAG1891798.1 hypothetical protein F5891DRAFT_1197425 [Suillus fuscotomentosus]
MVAHRRRITFESSGSSESDTDSASSCETSQTPHIEKSTRSAEPFKGRKCEHKSSSSDNDDKTKSSERPRSQKQDNQAIQNTPRTRERCTLVECNKSLLLIPAGFHAVVKADGAEYQTSNKSVNVDQTVVEWHERILLLCNTSSKVRVSVYASFELGFMLCHGELLRTFEISVGELLDRSETSHPIIFQPKQEEVLSACTSLFMTVEQQFSEQNDTAVFCPITTLTSHGMDGLALMMDAGHRLLARYCRMQSSEDLEQSIKHFEWASDLCPLDHPYRPAALFNLATVKFASCQADKSCLDVDIPISLFQDALDFRPTDHLDRTVTQLHLAIGLLSHFAKWKFQVVSS